MSALLTKRTKLLAGAPEARMLAVMCEFGHYRAHKYPLLETLGEVRTAVNIYKGSRASLRPAKSRESRLQRS